MAPSVVHLPNGYDITVTPVFGGLSFKATQSSNHYTPFPPGWTISLHTAANDVHEGDKAAPIHEGELPTEHEPKAEHHSHRFTTPTLQNDHLFISSITNPATTDSQPHVSPARQTAMMLWATLWWYFHQPKPSMQVESKASAATPEAGRPKADWKICIDRKGIFQGKHLLPKLERMGLLVNEESCVGLDPNENPSAWAQMYITRRHFWQLDPRIYLFTLSPTTASPFMGGSPVGSRTSSPSRGQFVRDNALSHAHTTPSMHQHGPWSRSDPFHSNSHLPTYYPPAPTHYTWTGNVRHPQRQKPPRQGETFYTRFVPSLGATLSFRVASLAQKTPAITLTADSPRIVPQIVDGDRPSSSAGSHEPSDVELLHKWMNLPRVSASWGEQGPIEHQQAFLENGLKQKNSFPAIGCFDGKPFGYFEIYWVKEDRLGQHISNSVGDWDRGFHLLVGEDEFRGPHRVKVWLSALTHYCFLADLRTQAVMLEPRVDNEKMRRYCEEAGFFKEREVTFPHKQSNLMKIYRDTFEAPCL